MVVSQGSWCTGCMLIIQYCYTVEWIKHKTKGTYKSVVLYPMLYTINCAIAASDVIMIEACDCVVNSLC